VGFVRRHPLLVGAIGAVLVVLAVLSTTAIAVWRAAHRDEASRIDRVDVIIVLGAAQYDGRPSPVFQGRLEHAALLYREHFSPHVLVLGGNRPGDVTTEAAAGRSWLVSDGLPRVRVFAEPKGNTTLESLRYATAFMRRHDMETAFLVSDPWHNLRIRRMARDLGIDGFVSATFHSAARSQWTRFDGYARETFAYLYYRVFHR
jgi:uncharacterized SAM-binding protein YcdF (DUF218 family)